MCFLCLLSSLSSLDAVCVGDWHLLVFSVSLLDVRVVCFLCLFSSLSSLDGSAGC